MLTTLMPDWKTIKTLLQVYALSDGRELFHSSKPKLATQAAAPYIESTAQWVKDTTSSAFLTGTTRFALQIPVGMTDFFGPIAEETIVQAVTRMGGELVNGVTGLTTRLASLMVGRASHLSEFDHRVAWTEWAWSVVPYLLGARAVTSSRPPNIVSEPMMLGELASTGAVRVYSSATSSGLGLPAMPPPTLMMVANTKPQVSEKKFEPTADEVRRLYNKHNGRVADVAKELGVSRMTVYNWLKRFELMDELPVRRVRRGGQIEAKVAIIPGPISNRLLAELYVESGFNWLAVSERIELSLGAVYLRINRATRQGSPILTYLIEVQRGQVLGKRITNHHIAATLLAFKHDLVRASAFLKMPPEYVVARVKRFSKSDSLLNQVDPAKLQ